MTEERKNLLKSKEESDQAYNANAARILSHLQECSVSRLMLATQNEMSIEKVKKVLESTPKLGT